MVRIDDLAQEPTGVSVDLEEAQGLLVKNRELLQLHEIHTSFAGLAFRHKRLRTS